MNESSALSRRERKKRDCKYAILRAAKELMLSRGIEVSIEEIASGADISYPTFFNYFPTKASLYYAIYLEEIEDIREFAALELKEVASAEQRILRMFAALAEDFSRYPYLDLYVAGEVAKRTREAGEDEQLSRMFVTCIEAGQAAGEFKKTLNARRCALLITGALLSASFYGCNRADGVGMLHIVLDSMRESDRK